MWTTPKMTKRKMCLSVTYWFLTCQIQTNIIILSAEQIFLRWEDVFPLCWVLNSLESFIFIDRLIDFKSDKWSIDFFFFSLLVVSLSYFWCPHQRTSYYTICVLSRHALWYYGRWCVVICDSDCVWLWLWDCVIILHVLHIWILNFYFQRLV